MYESLSLLFEVKILSLLEPQHHIFINVLHFLFNHWF
jgi:hypothetical protein